MKRSKIFILFLGALMTTTVFALNASATGPVMTKNVSLRTFSDLSVRNQFDVYISQGNEEKLIIETYQGIMPYVNVKQQNGKLDISMDRKIKRIIWLNRDHILKLHITVKNIDNISLAGACDMFMETPFEVSEFRINASGASDLDLNKISGEKISIITSGASDIMNAELIADHVYINASGSSDGDVIIKAESVRMIASGASDFDLEVDANELSINANGSSDFYARGRADQLEADLSGSSTLKGLELKTVNTKVSASGSSDCRVYVTGSLKASSSGASTIYYTGDPDETSISVSGVASIKSK